MSSLQGKNIFVTGGSRGIGAAIVRCLASRGATVGFSYTSSEAVAQEVLHSLPSPQGPERRHFIVPLDVKSEDSVNQATAAVLTHFPEIDGLVNNAGIVKDTLLLRMKSEDFDSVINTNLRGTFLVTKAFLKSMLKARKGSIVNITSVIGQMGNAGQANYAASKAGIEAFSKSVALEVGSRGIRVNSVAPGFIATEMTHDVNPALKEQMISKIPMQRIADAEEVAFAVAFLLSDESKYVTGQTLNVNGGLWMG